MAINLNLPNKRKKQSTAVSNRKTNPTQPDTNMDAESITHDVTICKLNNNSKGTPDTTRHNPTQYIVSELENSTQRNTTRHNATQLDTTPDTTQHNEKRNPTQTRHHTRHNATQPDTTLFPLETEIEFLSLSGNKQKAIFGLAKLGNKLMTSNLQGVSYTSLAEAFDIKVSSIRTTLKRLKTEGLIKIISAKGGRGATINIEFGDLKYQYNRYIETQKNFDNMHNNISQTRHKPDTALDTNPLVGRLVNKNNNNPTNKVEEITSPYHDYLNSDFLKELHDSGIYWSTKDTRWAESHEINPKVLIVSLRHLMFDIKNKVLQEQNVKSPIAWFKGSIKNNGAYASEEYFKVQKRRKEAEDSFLAANNEKEESTTPSAFN